MSLLPKQATCKDLFSKVFPIHIIQNYVKVLYPWYLSMMVSFRYVCHWLSNQMNSQCSILGAKTKLLIVCCLERKMKI
uniref:Ovule protein n=1 Tax=Romanomermis culicivorax TaxID=13658 RepID=A0A915KMD7_ROMCU